MKEKRKESVKQAQQYKREGKESKQVSKMLIGAPLLKSRTSYNLFLRWFG
jgi:hypothetical protein